MTTELRIVTWEEGEPGAYTVAAGTEVREARDGKLEGYAIVYDALSRDLGGFVERVAKGAVELASDVLGTFNHSLDHLLGRTGSGTLELGLDDRGLRYRIDLPDTGAGRDVRALVRRGDIRGSSFTFRTIDQAWSKSGAAALRTLQKIRVTEVGPVILPAYPDTTAAMRSLPRGGPADGDTAPGKLAAFRRKLSILDLYCGGPRGD